MPIRRLPPLLVNQIAAGEVIERPASVVKECVENAIDAGASRVTIEIEAGGRELVRITDDGDGIAMEELPLAIAAHATSKIADQDDLDAIATLGFRGEALASIASVSRMSILSRRPDAETAAVIEAEGDTVRAPRPAGGPPGTTVTVRNLFFNTPARRKFLKTDQTETGRISDITQNLALAHPAVGLTLIVDGRKAIELSPGQTAKHRAIDVLGPELEDELLEFDVHDRGMHLWGLAGKPDIARGTGKHQRVFLNGRTIADRSILHAIKEAYRGLIEPTRHPTIVLFIQIDPALVDVNVHPTKAEVRFRNGGIVHGAVLSAVRGALRQADLTPMFDLNRTGASMPGLGRLAIPAPPLPEFGRGRVDRGDSSHDGTDTDGEAANAQLVEYLRRLDPKQKGFIYSEVRQALASEAPEMLEDREASASAATSRDESTEPLDVLPRLRAAAEIMQVHSSYLVTQDEQGLVIIDQHALHERVMFEKLRERVERGPLESQRLLMPATVELDRSQIELLDALQPLLAKLGIEAEAIGPRAIAVHAFTSLLFARNVDPVTFMTELFDKAANEGLNDDREAALSEVLDMMACKAAIKAGDRMSAEELSELLKYRERIERSSNCPHGRPTSLRLSLRDLEKQFGRS